jgi:hypothetical protein
MRVRDGGAVPKLEGYMRTSGCKEPVIVRFRELIRQGKKVGFAVAIAIREMMPALYHEIRHIPNVEPNWTFRKLLKEYARLQSQQRSYENKQSQKIVKKSL